MSKLKKLSTTIRFTTDTGFHSNSTYSTGVEAIDELARIMTIDGQGDDALKAVTDAVARTKADLEKIGKEWGQ